MELVEKIKAIIERLERIKAQNNLNIDELREQINKIESVELLRLDEEFEALTDSTNEGEDSSEKDKNFTNRIRNLLIHADDLIHKIREQYGLKNPYDDKHIYLQDDDEIETASKVDEDDNDKYNIVLKEVSKSALKSLGVENDDELTITLMETIIIGICSQKSDDEIAGRAFAEITIYGFILPMDKIKEICKETREKCKKQLFGLQIAISSLQEYNCSAEEALLQIGMFL